MHFTTLLASVAALAPMVSAVGDAVVVNNCADPVYLWSVGSSVSPMQTIEADGQYSEVLHYDDVSGGISLKITTGSNGLYDGSPQTNFAYSLDGNNIWYDLSDVFGDPFSGNPLVVTPSITTCPNICWASGVSPSGSQTQECDASSNITLTLCADQC
ncbi:uncharacterized protein N7459_010124 [Penicillium hispanicum]|uniref:uncharacterized protein n=1 Tax=Penicillium hispanicum TaxID=1080232 RepID=UPI002541BE8A|nr:uncharacterized protein N7459_010124 [Penicillium hispanicum]KAJ5566742.1 hypothetical protein N7459_010124 [Penicillium hispanicum]